MQLAPELQKDFQTTTGLYGYNLLPTALTLFPAATPLRNSLPRIQGKFRQSEFKAIVGLSGDTLGNIWGTEGVSGGKVDLQTEDIFAVYRSMKLAVGVSFEQQWVGQGFIDSKATAVVNLLRQFMIQEEISMLFGLQSVAASNQFGPGAVGTCPAMAAAAWEAAPSGVTVTPFSPATAPTIKVTAVTGMGESLPVTVGSIGGTYAQNTSVLALTLPARAGSPILYFRVYGGTKAVAGDHAVQAYTPAGGSAKYVPAKSDKAGIAVLPGSTVIVGDPTVTAAPPVADATASAQAYNGLLAQLYGSSTYSYPTTTTPYSAVGATVLSAGGPLVAGVSDANAVSGGTNSLENFLATMYSNALADPEWLLMHQNEARAITRTTLGEGTPYFLVPQGAPQDGVANFRVSRYVNPVTGREVILKVHPYLNPKSPAASPGVIIAGQDSMPSWYVPTDIPAPCAMDMLQDYTEIDYPPAYATGNQAWTGDSWVVEVLNMGALKMFVPPIFGVLDSIYPV